jgi:hypothetical protein
MSDQFADFDLDVRFRASPHGIFRARNHFPEVQPQRSKSMRKSVLRTMPCSRLTFMLLTLMLAAGASRSQVNDIPMGLPSVDYVDNELNSNINRMAFNDKMRDGNGWVANVNPQLGTFISPDGLDLFIDDHMSTFEKDHLNLPTTGCNYIEWVKDNGEDKVLYTRLEGNIQRMYIKNLTGGPRELVGPNDGISRAHQQGSKSDTGRVTVAYRRWVSSDQSWHGFWVSMNDPSHEFPMPGYVYGGGPPQFIQSRYILYQATVGQVVQIIKYDTETHLFRALTDDTGDKYSPYSWEAPELGGGRLYVAEAIPIGSNKYQELRVYWQKSPGDSVLSLWATLPAPPEAGPYTYFTSPEPFVYKNHSYVSLILSTQQDIDDTEVWAFSVPETSGGQPYTKHQRVDTPTIVVKKLDPEWYVKPDNAFIYYWYVDTADANSDKLRRCVFEPGPPQ